MTLSKLSPALVPRTGLFSAIRREAKTDIQTLPTRFQDCDGSCLLAPWRFGSRPATGLGSRDLFGVGGSAARKGRDGSR